jgi:hypothetical protein
VRDLTIDFAVGMGLLLIFSTVVASRQYGGSVTWNDVPMLSLMIGAPLCTFGLFFARWRRARAGHDRPPSVRVGRLATVAVNVALVLANALRLVQNGMPYFRFEVPMMLLMFAAPIAALYALAQDWRDPSRW